MAHGAQRIGVQVLPGAVDLLADAGQEASGIRTTVLRQDLRERGVQVEID